MSVRSRRAAVSCLVLTTLGASWPHMASAANINVAALGFVPRTPASEGSAAQGMLGNEGGLGTYYAAVSLPSGESVCRFMFWARDNDADHNVVARLVRKAMVHGAGSGFGPSPQVMAQASTTGGSQDTQRVVDATIAQPLITTRHVYWVEIEFTGGFIDALGVRIVTAPTCS